MPIVYHIALHNLQNDGLLVSLARKLEKRLDAEVSDAPNLEFELTLTSTVLGGCLFVVGVSLAVTCRCFCLSRGKEEKADERCRVKDRSLRAARDEIALYRRREVQWLGDEQSRRQVAPRQELYIREEEDSDEDIQPSGNVVNLPRVALPPPVLLPDLPLGSSMDFATGARRRPSSSRVGGGGDDSEQFELTTRGESVQPAAESSYSSFLLDNSAMGLLAKIHLPRTRRARHAE
jgi:hypothetical protein